MRTIARLGMIILGIFMVVNGVMYAMDAYNLFTNFSWETVEELIETPVKILTIFKAVSYTLFGIDAAFAGIFGRGKFRHFLSSAIIVGATCYSLYLGGQTEAVDILKDAVKNIFGFVIPALYILFSLLLIIFRKK